MNSFYLPLSADLDFGLDDDGHVVLRPHDGRPTLHLRPASFLRGFN